MRLVYFICYFVYFNCIMCELSAARRDENWTVSLIMLKTVFIPSENTDDTLPIFEPSR